MKSTTPIESHSQISSEPLDNSLTIQLDGVEYSVEGWIVIALTSMEISRLEGDYIDRDTC